MNRGEVWRLSPGTKPTGAGEGRLVVILSSDALAVLPLRVVVPLLAWREDFAAALQSLDDFSESYQAATDQPLPLFRRRVVSP